MTAYRPWSNRRLQKHFVELTKCVELSNVEGAEIPAMKVEEIVYTVICICYSLVGKEATWILNELIGEANKTINQ